MSKLVLFDGNAIIHRAYHALPSSLKTRSGEPINAVYGMVSMLINVLENLEPEYLAFAWDHPEPNFRSKLLPDYQAQRPPVDDELISQFKKAHDVLKAMNISIFEKKGFEADDLIGTISKSVKDTSVVVVTGDRDLLQLIDKNITLFMPGKSLSDAKIYGSKESVERIGVPPEQVVDFKALVGDPSDNYKGIPGVGPKTAIDLLTKYKTLDNIYKNLDEIKETLRNKLIEFKESAYLSQKLATIVQNVDVEFSLEDFNKWNLGSDKLLRIFDEWGVKTLKKRVIDFEKKKESAKQGSLF